MELTDEQVAALAFFRLGMTLRLEARAGAGKTSTLRAMAASTSRPGQLVAFNKAVIADAAKVMPGHVACSTMHSLAWRRVGRNLSHRLDGERMRSSDIARLMKISHLTVRYGSQTKVLQPGFLASLVMRSVNAFCQTAAEHPGVEHIPYLDGIDEPLGEFGGRGMANNLLVHAHIGPCLERAWADLQDPDGQLPYSPAAYLKQWERGDPRIGGDFILVDEAQDQSGVMLSILLRQAAQLIAVGDSEQQLYEWLGAHNALQKIPTEATAYLTRCQPAGTMVRIPVWGRTESGRGSAPLGWREVPIESLRVGDRVVSWKPGWGLVLKGRAISAISVRPHDGRVVVAKAAGAVSRYAPNHECVVVLGGQLAEGNYVVYLMRRGNQFRVGRAPWRYSNGTGPIRRAVGEGADALWLLSVHPSEADAALAEALAQTRFGLPGVCFVEDSAYKMSLPEFWSKLGDNTAQAEACLLGHALLIDHPLWSRADPAARPRGGWNTRVVTAAANLRSGMLMLVPGQPARSNGSKQGYVPWSAWSPVTVSSEWYSGLIFSLSVEKDETYVADGIVTHNSWRFGPAIAEVANAVLRELGADPLVEGCDVPSRVERIDGEPDALLCRSNAEAVRRVLGYQRDGLKVHLVGTAGQQVVAFAEAAQQLDETGFTSHRELACFSSWKEVQAYVEQDPSGGELALLVGLVQEFGPEVIIDALAGMPGEEAAQLVVSTAHQSKGREWGRVRLASDFQEPEGPGAAGEWRLLYVSATRAQHVLDLAECEPLMTLLDGPTQQTLLS